MNEKIIKRNLELMELVTQYILGEPALLERLPPEFRLVILPEDDPELSLYNLNLLNKHSSFNKAIVMVRLCAQQLKFESQIPQLYVPLAMAA